MFSYHGININSQMKNNFHKMLKDNYTDSFVIVLTIIFFYF